jgi:hypothetical protein
MIVGDDEDVRRLRLRIRASALVMNVRHEKIFGTPGPVDVGGE